MHASRTKGKSTWLFYFNSSIVRFTATHHHDMSFFFFVLVLYNEFPTSVYMGCTLEKKKNQNSTEIFNFFFFAEKIELLNYLTSKKKILKSICSVQHHTLIKLWDLNVK